MAVRVAFPLIGRGAWTGGAVYLKNTLRLIRDRLGREIEASVFLSPADNERYGAELSALVEGRMIVDPIVVTAGRGHSLARAIVSGRDAPLERELRKAGADVVFEVAGFYGARFGIPVVAWLPDFQHRLMPEMFSRASWWRRDLGFRMQIRSGRTVMLSSETAKADLERFYPSARGRAHVVPFAIDMEIAPLLVRGAEMRATYGLPERFFFLPNQFWRHKNHAVIVAALAQLKSDGALDAVPPIILSGLGQDPRHPLHFDQLMAGVRSAGVDGHFRYLGLIPYDHVLSLNAACATMINASLFEGWSTPIEEAKALGTPLLLSDLAIHREQAPQARLFDPRGAQDLAGVVLDVARQSRAVRAPVAALMAAQNRRLDAHAGSFLAVVKAAVTATQRNA